MRDLILVTAQPDDRHFAWETEIQINNFRKYGLSHKFHVLVYWEWRENKPNVNFDWLNLRFKYPEVHFHFYREDPEDLHPSLISGIYPSVIRPFCLKKFWESYPELEEKAVFYLDSDVIFSSEPNWNHLLDDDVCYLSDTVGYLGIDYMRYKASEVGLPQDHFINIAANITGIDKQLILDNAPNHGGAQYLLKGVTADLWRKVQEDCLTIKRRFAIENQRHFVQKGIERKISTEDAGIQSWCADMWAVLYALLAFNKEVKVTPELDFAWPGEPLKRSEGIFLYHNTGTGNDPELFDKINYRFGHKYQDMWPWQEDLSYVNPDKCSIIYANAIKETYKDILNV